jgi:hypothetical protein
VSKTRARLRRIPRPTGRRTSCVTTDGHSALERGLR